MEHFKGSLAHYRPQLLIPAFFGGKGLEGTLRLQRAAVERRFVFREGRLIAQSSTAPGEHLAQILVDLNHLDSEESAAAFERAESMGMAFGTYLVDHGLVSRQALIDALRHKAREALFDCYTWESGEVEFEPVAAIHAEAVELTLELEILHGEASTQAREWRIFHELFPAKDTVFRVFREFADAREVTAEEAAVLDLAERGASLGELLTSIRASGLSAARCVLHLYRRGALSPQRSTAPRLGHAAEISDLLSLARGFLTSGKFDSALAVAGQVLECAPVEEAHALYRDAEAKLTHALRDEFFSLDERLVFEPMPRPTPAALTADDLYLYSKLRSSRSVRDTLRNAAMGELAASRSVQRLMIAGILRLAADRNGASGQRKTDPFGQAPVSR